jgi:hypothetical protein
MKNIKIPIETIFEMDDVRWDNGKDLRLYGQASRSGIPRKPHKKQDRNYDLIFTRFSNQTNTVSNYFASVFIYLPLEQPNRKL